MTEGSVHKLGEVLRTAREAKGVDLPRVERDTKIRARYLSALERGEYRELPGAVYTKGFLRNYGLYLSLDPEYLIDLYRLESGSVSAERASVTPMPRPIAVRRSRAFVLTPNVVVAALLTVLVLAIGAYLVSQLIAFAGTPDLRVVNPPGPVASYDGDAYTLQGVTAPNARVSVEGPRQNPVVTADEEGVFEVTVALVPGVNLITLSAYDPTTGRTSPAVERQITVVTALPSGSPGAVAPVVITAPVEGATLTGSVTVAGTAPAGAGVTITATATAAPAVTFAVVNAAGQAVQVASQPPAAPVPLAVTADGAGAFGGQLALAPGSWTISAAVTGGQPVTRQVTVGVPAGLSGTLVLDGGDSYLEIDEDGRGKAGISGTIADDGATVSVAATRELRVRAGNAGAVIVTINGIRIGPMGDAGAVVEWRITRR
ncbi:MAG TPA: RodZ domain-containing protein [Candidatus Limnocylindria bacterium]|nr:RodZ domain-containing protein [Candidatus Limnocylindria bacterium]